MNRALIGSICRYSLHDGPGIRTTVFFKGCPLRCPWCHNPELVQAEPEMIFRSGICIDCGQCGPVCPEGAVRAGGEERIDRRHCTACGRCAVACPAGALEMVGRAYDLDSLEEVLLRDRLYYETSGGGITLSGGEPTLQMGFAGRLLARLKRRGLHTAMETCGFFSWDTFAFACLGNLDLVLYDLKLADPVRHRQVTGRDNGIILANLARLLSVDPARVLVRIPLIPGYTATEDNITGLAALLRTMGVHRYSLLPYHPGGLVKGEHVGRPGDATLPATAMPTTERERWQRYFGSMEFVPP
ncbi:glycyl-radical enzyme activating protein [Thermodesulfobacteriota bacterium B35]